MKNISLEVVRERLLDHVHQVQRIVLFMLYKVAELLSGNIILKERERAGHGCL